MMRQIQKGKSLKLRSQARIKPKKRKRKSNRSRMFDWLSPQGLFWTTIMLGLTLLGSYYFFRPNVSAEAETSLRPESLIASVFRITNRSIFPIFNVNRSLHANLIYDSVSGGKIENSSSDAPLPTPHIPKLASGESTTVKLTPLGFGLGRPDGQEEYTDADVEVVVSFTTAVLHRNCTKRFRFEGHMGADKMVHWFSKALSLPRRSPTTP
jgi:hypothetical protein